VRRSEPSFTERRNVQPTPSASRLAATRDTGGRRSRACSNRSRRSSRSRASCARAGNWLVYHQAFLLEEALGPDALLAAQPGQLVPVRRAIRMSRVRLLLADGVGTRQDDPAGLVLTELMARRWPIAFEKFRTRDGLVLVSKDAAAATSLGSPRPDRP
jgi:hypothetical protein